MYIEIALLILAAPLGFIIAWMARDELKIGRNWFIIVVALSLITGIYFFINNRPEIIYSSAFIAIVSGISILQSYDKKWTAKKFK